MREWAATARPTHPLASQSAYPSTQHRTHITPMKITRITPIMADGGHRIIVFVKVETDQPGLVGWGEATLEGKPRAVAGCINDMEPMIVGLDPRRIEYCWQILYRSGFWRMGVIGLSALSGIDQALWDIRGKELGVPVYELLG